MRKQPVQIGKRRFTSMTAAGNALRTNVGCISYRCHAQTGTELTRNCKLLKPIENNRRVIKNGVIVIAAGMRFSSLVKVANIFSISPAEVRRRIKSDRYSSWFLFNPRTQQVVEY